MLHRFSIPVVIVSFILTATTFAQEGAKPFSAAEWGKEQRVREMLDYWRSWEMSGPDTNIEAARQNGLRQFLSMPRPKSFGQQAQAVPAWELVASSTAQGKVSGRPTDIAFDSDPNIMYLATSGGGLWKTTNAQSSKIRWVPVSNSFASNSIGAVAVDTLNGIVYAATGDLHNQDGDGLYKSADGGLNWERIATQTAIGSRTSQLLLNPLNPMIMYHTGDNGVRRSYDGGYTWKKVVSIGGITHMVLDPVDTNKMYAAGAGKIIRSSDGGSTWSGDLASNISGKYRITLGISAADPSKIYASISGTNGRSRGVGRSDDYGETWQLVASKDYMSSQGWYDNACAVKPTDAKFVTVGGLDIWVSTDSGPNLVQKTDWTLAPGNARYAHADIHVLKYAPNGKLYAMTDGGLFQSNTGGANFTNHIINSDLATLLFVGADAAPDMSYFIGGCQDNGVNRADADDTNFVGTDGGDGGRTFIAQNDPSVVYSSYYGASLKKSNNYGKAGSWNGLIAQGSPLYNEGTPFYMNYDVCESDGAYLAICGNSRVYFSEDGGVTINQISAAINPTSVHVSAADPYYIYVGTQSGYVYTTPDAGATWVKSTTKIGSTFTESTNPGYMTSFVSDPGNKLRAWTVTAGFGGDKFWLTEDGGLTWTAPATNFPNLSYRSIARAPNGDLFAGHNFGVVRSIDNGVTWEPLRDGIPVADITRLQVRGNDKEWLVAATYGHSIWKLNINKLPRTILESVASNTDPNFRIESITPNPVTSAAELRYKTSVDSRIVVTLYDELGREARLLANEYAPAGEHKLQANLGDLANGSYSVVITSAGKAITERLVIAK